MKMTAPVLAAAMLIARADFLSAAIITTAADPLLNSAKLIAFSEVANQTPNPTIAGVSFTGVGDVIYTISQTQNMPEPPWLSNSPLPVTAFDRAVNCQILFSRPVRAFGSLFSAINENVTVEAFNGLTSLGATTFNPGSPFSVVFRGIGFDSAIITRATVSVLSRDIILLDDFRFVIPEPTMLDLISVCGVLLSPQRRKLTRFHQV